jgi:deoxyribodipyrimidine photolyase
VTADMAGGPRRAISGLPHRNKLSLKNVGLPDMAWLVLVCTLASAHAEKRVAVVVGNAAYRYTDKLDNPVNDAQAMASRPSPFCRSGELSLRGMVTREVSTTVERLSALHGARDMSIRVTAAAAWRRGFALSNSSRRSCHARDRRD